MVTQSPSSILITGGAGFIGKFLLKELSLLPDVKLWVVDNFCNSSKVLFRNWLKAEGLYSRVHIFSSSVENWKPKDLTVDQIYHLASPVGPAGVLNYAGYMAPMILNDAIKMAKFAVKSNARMIDISTSEVYGKDPSGIPQREDIDKIVPSNITVRLEYGVGKLASEVSLLNMAKVTSLKINFIRPFNVVGPGQRGEVGFVLPRFIDSALKGEPLTVFGDGSQKRAFTSVRDFTKAVVAIMNSGANREIFNVGNPKNLCSVMDLAKTVVEVTRSRSEIVCINPKTIYGPLYEEAWNKIPNIDKIQSVIGWEPQFSVRDIVEDAVLLIIEG